MQFELVRQRASCEPYLIVLWGERGGDAGSMAGGVARRSAGRWCGARRRRGVEGRRWGLRRRGCRRRGGAFGMYCSLCGGR